MDLLFSSSLVHFILGFLKIFKKTQETKLHFLLYTYKNTRFTKVFFTYIRIQCMYSICEIN